jgi:hypothetical protein
MGDRALYAEPIRAGGEGRHPESRLRLIEPFGFAKISALGVEEQRVNVVIDFVNPRKVAATGGRLPCDWQDRARRCGTE